MVMTHYTEGERALIDALAVAGDEGLTNPQLAEVLHKLGYCPTLSSARVVISMISAIRKRLPKRYVIPHITPRRAGGVYRLGRKKRGTVMFGEQPIGLFW